MSTQKSVTLKPFGMLVAVLLGAVLGSREALAVTTITNSGTAAYNNAAAIAQATVTGSTTFTAQSDPVLSVVKTRNIGAGPAGVVGRI